MPIKENSLSDFISEKPGFRSITRKLENNLLRIKIKIFLHSLIVASFIAILRVIAFKSCYSTLWKSCSLRNFHVPLREKLREHITILI